MSDLEEFGQSPDDLHGGHWTPERLELRQWLSLKAHEVGAVYTGAIHVIYSRRPIPGREHFVAHAGREIWNAAMEFTLGRNPRSNDLLDELARKWHGSSSQHEDCKSPIGIKIPISLYQFIDGLCDSHMNPVASRTRTAQFLSYGFGNGAHDISDEAERIHHAITRFFPKAAHVDRSGRRTIAWAKVVDGFGIMEAVLLAGIRPASEIRRDLDGILDETNN